MCESVCQWSLLFFLHPHEKKSYYWLSYLINLFSVHFSLRSYGYREKSSCWHQKNQSRQGENVWLFVFSRAWIVGSYDVRVLEKQNKLKLLKNSNYTTLLLLLFLFCSDGFHGDRRNINGQGRSLDRRLFAVLVWLFVCSLLVCWFWAVLQIARVGIGCWINYVLIHGSFDLTVPGYPCGVVVSITCTWSWDSVVVVHSFLVHGSLHKIN